jgi:uncharacterized membrane protein
MFKKRIYLLFFLSLIALLTSIYLTIEHYNKRLPYCIINTKCDIVLTSKYSEFLGIPLSLLGVIYFFINLVLLYLFLKNRFKKQYLILYNFIGASVGLILIYIQIFILKNLCIYCLTVDSISIINLFLIFFL